MNQDMQTRRRQLVSGLGDSGGALWIVLDQVASRASVGIKFLLVAIWLGPDAIGTASLALIVLQVVECLTETGLVQAYVQSKETISRQTAAAIWWTQLGRGGLVSVALAALAIPLGNFFGLQDASAVIFLTVPVPLLRNAYSLGLSQAYKDCDFRSLAAINVMGAIVDLIATAVACQNGMGAMSIIVGNLLCEAFKFVASWARFPMKQWLHPDWRSTRHLNRYGRWIWIHSVMNLFCNQYDKLVIAKLLGAGALGNMQMASKASQLIYMDVANTAAHFIFPKLSAKNRESTASATSYFQRVYRQLTWTFLLVTPVAAFAAITIGYRLAEAWQPAAAVFLLLIPGQFLSAVNAVLSAHLRALGRPKKVFQSAAAQALIMVLVTTPLCFQFGLKGAILGNTLAALAAFVTMRWQLRGART